MSAHVRNHAAEQANGATAPVPDAWSLLEAAPAALCVVDEELRVLAANTEMGELLGAAAEARRGRPLREISPALADQVEAALRQALATGEPVRGIQIEGKPGQRWLLSARPTGGGACLAIAAHEMDAASAADETAPGLLAAIVESSDDAIVSKTLDGVVTSWNAAAERLFGYTAEEAVGRHITMLIPEERRGDERMILERLRRGERIEHFETIRKTKDGRLLDISLSISPVRDRWGRVVGASKIARNITEQKQTQREIAELNARARDRADELQTLLDVLPVGVYIAQDPECRHISANATGTELLRLPAGANASKTGPEAHTLPFRTMRDGVEIAAADLPMQRSARTGELVRGETLDLVFEDGHVRQLYEFAAPLHDGAGNIRGSVAAFVDLTERRQTEETLRQRARQQAAVAQLGQVALAEDNLGRLFDLAVSTVAETLEIELCKVLELLPDGSEVLLRAGVGWAPGLVGQGRVSTGMDSQAGYTLHSEGPVVVEDLRAETRFNGPALLHDHGVVSGMSCVIGAGGERPWGVLGAHTRARRKFAADDVNFLQAVANVLGSAIRQRMAEQALRESQGRLSLAMVAGRMGAWDWDIASGRVAWSTTLEQIHGLAPGEFGGSFEEYQRDIHPDDRQRVLEAVGEALERAEEYHVEYRIIKPDGAIAWLESRGHVILDNAGCPARMVGVCADVTSRKGVEQALRESEVRFRQVVQGLPAAVYTCDTDGRILLFNEAAARLWGREPKLGEDLWYDTAQVRTPAGGEIPLDARPMAIALREGRPLRDQELVIERPDGTRRHVLANPDPILDSAGEVRGAINMLVDITERKVAEQALRESEGRFGVLADSAPVLIWVNDADGVTFVNESYREFLGVGFDQVSGFRWAGFVHPDDRDEYLRAYQKASEAHAPLEATFRFRRYDGAYRWMKSVGLPRMSGNRLVGYVGSTVDITDVMEAEEALRRSFEQLRVIYGLSDAVSRAGSPDEINRRAVDGVIEALGVDRSALLLLDDEGAMRFAAWRGLSDEYRAAVDGHSPWTANDVEPEPVVIGDVEGAAELGALREVIRREGIGALAFVPLTYGGRLLGKLMLYCDRPRELGAEEIRLAQTIAGHVAFAIGRARAEEALREGEERFRTMADNIAQFAWMADGAGSVFWYNQRWFEYTGARLEEMQGEGWTAVHHPDHVERVLSKFRRHVKAGEIWEDTFPLRGADGEYRWFLSRAVPIRDAEGRVVRWFGTNTDVTEAREAHEERLKFVALVENSLDFIAMASVDGRMIYLNPAARRLIGLGPDEDPQAMSMHDCIPPHLHAQLHEETIPQTLEHGYWEGEAPFQHRRTGEQIPMYQTMFLIRYPSDGGELCLATVAQNITARKRHEEQMQLVMAELNHRVKNTLAVVDSMARQTLRSSPAPEAFIDAFGERLGALARVHGMLTETHWEGVPLHELVAAELQPRIASPEQGRAEGPPVTLAPGAALTLHMVLHELATNAAKHGALSAPGGVVRVTWRIEGAGDKRELRLEWVERGGPAVAPPTHSGFGGRVLSRLIEYELGGRSSLEMDPAGVRCEITAPWSGLVGVGGGVGA